MLVPGAGLAESQPVRRRRLRRSRRSRPRWPGCGGAPTGRWSPWWSRRWPPRRCLGQHRRTAAELTARARRTSSRSVILSSPVRSAGPGVARRRARLRLARRTSRPGRPGRRPRRPRARRPVPRRSPSPPSTGEVTDEHRSAIGAPDVARRAARVGFAARLRRGGDPFRVDHAPARAALALTDQLDRRRRHPLRGRRPAQRRRASRPASRPGSARSTAPSRRSRSRTWATTRPLAGGRRRCDGPLAARRGHRPAWWWTPLGLAAGRCLDWEHAATTALAHEHGWIDDGDWAPAPPPGPRRRRPGQQPTRRRAPDRSRSRLARPGRRPRRPSASSRRPTVRHDPLAVALDDHARHLRTARARSPSEEPHDRCRARAPPARRAVAIPLLPDEPRRAGSGHPPAARPHGSRAAAPSRSAPSPLLIAGGTTADGRRHCSMVIPGGGLLHTGRPLLFAAHRRAGRPGVVLWWAIEPAWGIPAVWAPSPVVAAVAARRRDQVGLGDPGGLRPRRPRDRCSGVVVRAPLPHQAVQGARAQRLPAHRRRARAVRVRCREPDDHGRRAAALVLRARPPAARRVRRASSGASSSTAAPASATS